MWGKGGDFKTPAGFPLKTQGKSYDTGIWQNLVTFYLRHSCQICISKLPQSLNIGKNTDGGVSDFRVSDQSLIKENYRNFGSSHNIDMKLAPVATLDKGNKITSKNLTITSCWQIVTSSLCFPIYGQFEAIRKPDSGCKVCKTYIFISFNLLSYKNSKQN